MDNYLPSTNSPKPLNDQVIIREQSEAGVKLFLAGQLTRLAKLYAIPGWDADSAVLLAEWIMETYATESLRVIALTLQNPPIGKSKTWRLTPDTISEWMTEALEREADHRERSHREYKPEPEILLLAPGTHAEWTEDRLNDWLASLEKVEARFVSPPMTEAEIKRWGAPIPPQMKYKSTGVEYLVESEQRRKWMRECTDMHTGRVTGLSYDEWLRAKKN